jgi:hypothetical protein
MLKDYTDYVLTVYSSGERVLHDFHYLAEDLKKRKILSVRCVRANFNPRFKYRFNGFEDRAFGTRLSPWKKWDRKHPIDSLKELARSKRIGHLHYLEPSDSKAPDEVEPIPISRIHQPSGRLEGQLPEVIDYYGQDIKGGLPEEITPYDLKVLVDNNFYMQAFKTFKFGFKGVLSSHRWIWIVVGVIGVVVAVLYFTGRL